MAVSRNYFNYVLRDFLNKETNEPLIKAFETNIITLPIEMLVTKGTPIRDLINIRLLQITQAGLIDFWTRSIMHKRTVVTEEKRRHTPLKISQMSTAFYGLLLGHILTILIFLGEYICSRFKISHTINTTKLF